MGISMTLAIIMLVILLAIVICVLVIIQKIKRSKIPQIIDMVMDADAQFDTKPKSISGGDSLYIDRILSDFKDFDLAKAKALVENTISSVFSGELDAPFAKKLLSHYNLKTSSLKFHNTAISNYYKSEDSATIKFQSAFEIKIGDKLKQERFETEYTLFFKDNEEFFTFNCDNCGAPLKSANIEKCEYCGSGIKVVLEKIWNINDINRK